MKFKFNIKRELKFGIALALIFGLIAFTERRQERVAVTDVIIRIENIEDNHFIDEQDVISLMQLSLDNLKGASMDQLDLKSIERRITSDPFIRSADLYSDLKGNLIVKAVLRRPIARMVRNQGHDTYIAEDGTIMPVHDKFNARVILISGGLTRKLMEGKTLQKSEDGVQLLSLLELIRKDNFWKAQIAQLDIDSNGRVIMFPQVGDETIEFGKLNNQEKKLKKLRVYYKEILPQKGWNKYKRVNVEFEDQIIAE